MTVHFESLSKDNALDVVVSGAEPGLSGGVYRSVGKRVLDLGIVLVTAPVWVPIFTIVWISLVLAGHRPFYTQERLGQNGRLFRMIKFRSMIEDAERALADHLAADTSARREWDAHQKLKNDPRITKIGQVLRKTSLDELPQLLNVLLGDMSLVGPRPMMVEQRVLYPGSAYYSLRPGITGTWQVSDRNSCEFRDRAEFDTRYFADMSFRRDISVLLNTISVVIRGTGY